jgi:hypothetical protein
MTKKGTLIVLCALCALTAGASAAPSAFALGTAPLTCKAGLSGFSTEHCVPGQTGTSFGHESIPEKVETEVEGNNQKTNSETSGSVPMKLSATISGVSVELVITSLDYLGFVTWGHPAGPNPVADGLVQVKFTMLSVEKPAGKGCAVKGKEVVSNELFATTLEQGMAVKLAPKEGTTLASFVIEGCSIPALNGTYELKGSLKGTPNGAVLEFSHASVTEQGTLTLRGQKAGIEGKVTLKARANSSQSYTPIGFTTTE